MSKPKSDYWAQREANEKKWIDSNLKNDADFNRLIQRHYDNALTEIQRDIDSEYQKYAGYSGSTMKQAIKAVSVNDVGAYQNKAAQIVAEARRLEKEKGRALKASDFTQEVNDQLKLYNATMRINRLEMLKSKVGLELTQANMNIQADLSRRLEQGYQDEIKRQAGILGETIPLTRVKETIETVGAQVDGASFSQRIWVNQAALKGQLDGVLTQAMIRGEGSAVLARKLKSQVNDAVNNRRYVTERLARTEMARVQDKAQMNSFDRFGYDFCKWIAEPSACQTCRDIATQNDGIYGVNDVPDIPVHANCRCSKAAWYEKDATKLLTDEDTRAIYDYIGADGFLLNEALRAGSIDADVLAKRDALNRALDKIPTYKGNLQRSVNFEDFDDMVSYLNQFNKGVVTPKQFLSAAKEPYASEWPIQIIISNSAKGHDLSRLNPKEQEVLYKTGQSFKVIDKWRTPDSKYYITLEELDD